MAIKRSPSGPVALDGPIPVGYYSLLSPCISELWFKAALGLSSSISSGFGRPQPTQYSERLLWHPILFCIPKNVEYSQKLIGLMRRLRQLIRSPGFMLRFCVINPRENYEISSKGLKQW